VGAATVYASYAGAASSYTARHIFIRQQGERGALRTCGEGRRTQGAGVLLRKRTTGAARTEGMNCHVGTFRHLRMATCSHDHLLLLERGDWRCGGGDGDGAGGKGWCIKDAVLAAAVS